jgi:NAD(P)-dependent dehydrogenase (short-subunit alcohol dehydrogenase family)
MNHALQNKRALVTGGSRGIGAAIVKRLAREGAHVALTYVSRPDEANQSAAAAQSLGVQGWPSKPIARFPTRSPRQSSKRRTPSAASISW